MDAFRVWLKSGGAMLLNATTHDQACVKATYQARANEKANGTDRDSSEWIKYTLVVKTENLSNPSVKKWSAVQVSDAIGEHAALQREYEDAIRD